MLIDDVTITVQAGRGGNGAATFRRTAQTPNGGPDGGNGGNGGDVVIQGSRNVSDLRQFQFTKVLKAPDGVAGKRNNLYGKNAEPLVIHVPLGTQVTDLTSGKVFEIIDDTRTLRIAKGGIGGRGNNEFKSATNQAPHYAESGTEGQTKQLRLELHLIADIGLIGLPNAGKSSLLAALTHAHPKIGDYPFTTLEPNLGALDGKVLADIPGLIEGASHGKGLGTKFLKHIEKTSMLIHCIASTSEDPLRDYHVVRKELGEFHQSLLEKPEIILLTKTDLVDEETWVAYTESLQGLGKDVLRVSIYDEDSIKKLKEFLRKMAEV